MKQPETLNDKYITIKGLSDVIRDYRNENQLDTIDDPESLIKAIVVESGELLDTITFKHDYKYMEGMEDELADVLIYCFALAQHKKLNIVKIINDKIRKNCERGRTYPKKERIKYDKDCFSEYSTVKGVRK